MLPKRQWSDMTWQDFGAADAARWIVVLPLAATEQHGPHLPVGVDRFIAEAYLARAAAQIPADLPVTFLPLQPIGQSDEHLRFPGTLSFSAETVIRAWTEIGESVHRAGVRKLVLISSHGGNVAGMDIVARDLRTRRGMLVVTAGWHRFGYPDGAFTAAERRHGIHAGDVETSIMCAARPDTVRMDKADNFVPASVGMEQEFRWLNTYRPMGFGWMTQDLHPSGGVGDATLATADKGAASLDHGARGFIELLREVDRFDLARLRQGPLG
ncbi:MAG: creatininase family protein [Rhizobiales bacterium]|nr:creatininase family protein [Hyphomicrobiales bacterium]